MLMCRHRISGTQPSALTETWAGHTAAGPCPPAAPPGHRRAVSRAGADNVPTAPLLLDCSCHMYFSGIAARIVAMSVAITVRDVPNEVRDEFAARAARAGKSLQEYLRGMLVDAASRPPVDDVIARARARVDVTGARVDARSILAARDADRR